MNLLEFVSTVLPSEAMETQQSHDFKSFSSPFLNKNNNKKNTRNRVTVIAAIFRSLRWIRGKCFALRGDSS